MVLALTACATDPIVVAERTKPAERSGMAAERRQAAARKPADDPYGFRREYQFNPATGAEEAAVVREAQNFYAEQRRQIDAIGQDYEAELNAAGWDSLLDPQRLRTDTTLAESRAIIARAKEIAPRYEARVLAKVHQVRAQISSVPVSDMWRQRMREDFDRVNLLAKAREQWKLELQIMYGCERLINILAGTEWMIHGHQLLILRDDDMARYNAQLEAVQLLGKQQEKLANSFSSP